MEFAVRQNGDQVGTVNIMEDKRAVTFEVNCGLEAHAVLRCFGVTDTPERPLPLGVLEPRGKGLYLHRVLTRQSLAAAGCGARLPEEYYLADSALGAPENSASAPLPAAEALPSPASAESPAPLTGTPTRNLASFTGDPLLDAALETDGIRTERSGNTLRVLFPFDPEKPFPLAFAFACCHIEVCAGKSYFVLEYQNPMHPSADT